MSDSKFVTLHFHVDSELDPEALLKAFEGILCSSYRGTQLDSLDYLRDKIIGIGSHDAVKTQNEFQRITFELAKCDEPIDLHESLCRAIHELDEQHWLTLQAHVVDIKEVGA